jgi:hypothetical protein
VCFVIAGTDNEELLSLYMNKLKFIGQNLGRVINCRWGHPCICHSIALINKNSITSSWKLKPRQFLGYLRYLSPSLVYSKHTKWTSPSLSLSLSLSHTHTHTHIQYTKIHTYLEKYTILWKWNDYQRRFITVAYFLNITQPSLKAL